MSDDPPAGGRHRLRRILPDLSPWRSSRDFRLMWCAGSVTVLGSFLTYVATPLQIKEITGSYLAVGLIGAALPALMSYDARTNVHAVKLRELRKERAAPAA